MKKYELVHLNTGVSLSRDKDVAKAQEVINARAEEGWELLQIVSPNDWGGALYGVFVKEA